MVRKILFVDDDEILQVVVEKGLATYSNAFDVILARDGFEALKKLESIAVSLIVIDLQMPRMDGLSTLSHIQHAFPDIPVIFISATAKGDIPYLSGIRGVIGYLEKPFGLDVLAKMILDALQVEAVGGAIATVSPAMFLQLMEMEGKTCTIRILDNHSMEGGILYLRDGRLLDARVGMITGIDGAYKVFRWDEVSVFFRNDCPEMEDRINSDLQAVIMGALAARDEADDAPFSESEGPIAGFAGDLEIDEMGPFEFPPSWAEDDLEEGQGIRTRDGSKKNDACERVRDLLHREVGDLDWIHSVYHDPRLDRAMTMLLVLGTQAKFGNLRVGHLDNGEGVDRILVPDIQFKQSTVLQVNREAPLMTIIDVFRYREEETGLVDRNND